MARAENAEIIDRFEEFYRDYYHDEIGELAGKYPTEQRSLYVDWDDVYRFDPDLAEDFLAQPTQMREYAEEALRLFDLPVDVKLGQAHVRVHNLPEATEIRGIRSDHSGRLVAVRGIVRKATDVLPKIQQAAFECQRCGTLTRIPQTSGGFQEPHECQGCERQGPFEINFDQSEFEDYQKLRVQESPEGLRGGETPQSIDVNVEDDITGKVTAGDHVKVTGVLHLEQQGSQQEKSPVFDFYMDGMTVEIEDEQFEDMDITDADKREIVELSNRPDIYELMVESLAPSLYGLDDEKLAIILQLFSGVAKELPDDSRIRGDLHLLLIGDPGTGKCVRGDTRVRLADGSEVPIRRLVERNLEDPIPVDDGVYDEVDFEVPSMAPDGSITTRPASKVWKREAPDQMYRVRTLSGSELEVTPSHPLFVRTGNGDYVAGRAEALTEGHVIATVSPAAAADGGSAVTPDSGPETTSNLPRRVTESPIEAIERVEPDYDWVYDLEVEGTHTYLSNDVVSHNSQLLQYVRNLAPRSVYTSGKGSSSAGLTAAAVRDDFGDSQQWTLEAGALVLADKGVAAVDELDKMRCVAGESLVETAEGDVSVADLATQGRETGSIDTLPNGRTVRNFECDIVVSTMAAGGTLTQRPVTAIHEYDAPETLYRVSLASGVSIVATPDHPFILETPNGWSERPAEDVDPGDGVAIPGQQAVTDGGVASETQPADNRAVQTDVVAEVTRLDDHGYDRVYDLTVEGTHNFVANGMVVHNSEDRSAMHEALEQQSYHPDSEILLADGRQVEIGEFVDSRMAANPESVVDGVDCEILPVDDVAVHSTDLDDRTTAKHPVDRVSRHKAPEEFVRVTFSNGRSVTVTPEHPMFVDQGGEIGTAPAGELTEGSFVPGPRKLPNSSSGVELDGEPHVGKEKDVTLPEEVTPALGELLGFLVAEGHSYAGSSHEIGFSNQDDRLLVRVDDLFEQVFGMESYDSTNAEGTVTKVLISTKLYRWFEANFPEFMHTARDKRIPAKVLGASEEVIRRFLVGAFAGDGGVESEAMSFSTASDGLAQDYADALSKIGVASRIHRDTAEDSWKVYVMGDSNERFVDRVVEPADERHDAAQAFVERGNETARHHDVLPTSAAREIRELKRLLGLRLTGQFKPNLDEGFGVQVDTVRAQLAEFHDRAAGIREALEDATSLAEVRSAVGWSGRQLAERMGGATTSRIHYAEDGGYDAETRDRVASRARETVSEALEEFERRAEALADRCDLRFYRVRDVETVPNDGEYATEWVYDVTVEPTNTFVSKGVVLHNSISISKAGINATLKSRCSLLGAANPKYGRFDQYESIGEQIDLEPALISRFDLIFTVTDQPDAERDRELADHIIRTNYAGELNTHREESAASNVTAAEVEEVTDTVEPAIDTDLLRKYVAHAKRNCFPTMTEGAKDAIRDFYVDLRSEGADEDAPVPVTARKLEALVRLAEASARVRLSDTVEEEDAQRVIDIVRSCLKDIGVDPETGQFDADVVETGTSKSQRDRIRTIKGLIQDLEGEYEDGAPVEEVLERAETLEMERSKAEHEIEKLKRQGEVYEPRNDHLRTT